MHHKSNYLDSTAISQWLSESLRSAYKKRASNKVWLALNTMPSFSSQLSFRYSLCGAHQVPLVLGFRFSASPSATIHPCSSFHILA